MAFKRRFNVCITFARYNKKFLDFVAAATPPPKTNDLLKCKKKLIDAESAQYRSHLIYLLSSTVGLLNSLPFVGFGFLDNFTMIIAGDYIEHSLGMIMTISTMAAAALGNTISDVLGIGSAVYVERMVEIIGVRAPDLTPVQLEMKSARRASNMVRFLMEISLIRPHNNLQQIFPFNRAAF